MSLSDNSIVQLDELYKLLNEDITTLSNSINEKIINYINEIKETE